MEEKKEKLAIHLTFKRSEKQLYNDIKKIQNHTQFIKDILSQHLYGTPTEQQVNGNKMIIGVDDICKIIESATKNLVNVTPVKTEPVNIDNQLSKNNMDNVTEKQNDNGFYNNDLPDELFSKFS